ncbi:MAG: hypothetical protein HKO92_02600 [Flavobacteriaceae bacterium]|nr:hypothetical protein [Flavobacteriaceae bacterium]
MNIPQNNSDNAKLFCSHYGHNYVLKTVESNVKELYVCKTCQKEFDLEDIFSCSSKNSDYISVINTLLMRFTTIKRGISS